MSFALSQTVQVGQLLNHLVLLKNLAVGKAALHQGVEAPKPDLRIGTLIFQEFSGILNPGG